MSRWRSPGRWMALICAMSLIVIVYEAARYAGDCLRLRFDDVEAYAEGWRLSDGWEVSLAGLDVTEPMTVEHALPEVMRPRTVLSLTVRALSLRASVDGVPVYSFDSGRSSGGHAYQEASWLTVLLPDDAAGGVLTLELLPGDGARVSGALLGVRHALLFHLLRHNAALVFVSLLIGVLALFVLVAALLRGIDTNAGRTDFYMGLFSLLTSVWVLGKTHILQFATGNQAALSYLSAYTFLLHPIALLLFIGALLDRPPPILSFMCAVQCGYIALRTALDLAGIAGLNEHIWMAHALMLVDALLAIVLCRGGARTLRDVCRATIVLAGLSVVSLALFYARVDWGMSAPIYTYVYLLGLLTFQAMLAASRLRSGLERSRQATMADYFERCAYTDELTGLGNFAACERAAREADRLGAYPDLYVVMFDLDNLKEANDEGGHQAGDALLRTVSVCLTEAYADGAQLFRIGGDEFAALVRAPDAVQAQRSLDAFSRALDRHNRTADPPVRCSSGMAGARELGWTARVGELLRLADERMYRQKHEKKKETAYAGAVRYGA